jgi:acid stress chaperone HdeB
MLLTRAGVAAVFSVIMAMRAEAQVTLDVSKITCDQYVAQRITHSRTVNIWLSGYYAGRSNKPVVDVQALERRGDKLSRFCESHRDMLLLDAVGESGG